MSVLSHVFLQEVPSSLEAPQIEGPEASAVGATEDQNIGVETDISAIIDPPEKDSPGATLVSL